YPVVGDAGRCIKTGLKSLIMEEGGKTSLHNQQSTCWILRRRGMGTPYDNGHVGIWHRKRAQIQGGLHANPVARPECSYESVLGQCDGSNMNVLLRSHLQNLSTDQFHTLVLEEA